VNIFFFTYIFLNGHRQSSLRSISENKVFSFDHDADRPVRTG